MMSLVQEGTNKKINRDRNQKTTRNIQEGLPHSIDDVKRQTEDKQLLKAVSKTTFNRLSVINGNLQAKRFCCMRSPILGSGRRPNFAPCTRNRIMELALLVRRHHLYSEGCYHIAPMPTFYFGLSCLTHTHANTHIQTHTQPLYGLFSGTTRVSRCQKKTTKLYGASED